MQTLLKATLSSIQQGETFIRSQGAVAFIEMLLLMAGIESNPGPLGDTNSETPESSGNLHTIVALTKNAYSKCHVIKCIQNRNKDLILRKFLQSRSMNPGSVKIHSVSM